MLSIGLALLAIPTVILSEEHAAMTRVAVGDAFPQIEGRSVTGAPTPLATLRGAKATVIATPGGPAWMDAMLAGDLTGDFAPRYGSKGVRLIALADEPLGEGVDTLAVAPNQIAETLGSGRLPRVYVLDAAGKVVWFDLEYTLSTHRELHATLDELIK